MDGVIVTESNRSDSNNQFFLHHSDNPGLVLVPKPLTGDNYAPWYRSMSKSLNAKNKLGFVDGTITAPSRTENPDDYALWSRCNDMVHSWIVNTLAVDIADSVIYYSTAREIWEDLRERFSQSNAPRIYEIQRDIAYLRQDQLSVAAYYTKLKVLWDELSSYSGSCQCGAQQDRLKLMQFLMGLNDSYSVVRGQVLLMNPLPTVRQAYSSIFGEERQMALAQSAPQLHELAAAMTIRGNKPERRGDHTLRGNQTYRGDQGRRIDQTRQGNRPGVLLNRRPHCTHCDVPGHYIETCYQLHGFPPGHPKHKSNRYKGGTPQSASTANSVIDTGEERNNLVVARHSPGQNQTPGVTSLSNAQLQQIMSILNNKENSGNLPQVNAISTPPGSGYEEDD